MKNGSRSKPGCDGGREQGGAERGEARGGGWRWVAWVMWGLVLAKLVLVSHDEIVVWGYDDAGFARSAAHWYWGLPYGQYGFVRQPVYPLFLGLSGALGLPGRLAIELVWIGACVVLVRGLRVCGAHWAVGLAAGALSLYHPWTLTWFNRLAQDNLYAPLALMFLVGVAGALASTARGAVVRWGALAAVAGALAANTRPEAILLYGTLGVAGVIALAQWVWKRADARLARRRVVMGVLVPLLAMQALTHTFRIANEKHIGVAVTTDFMLPGFKKLYTALLAIPPEGERAHDPRLPIQRDVREKAYAASPAFATLRPWLDGEHRMREFARACRRRTGVAGEYGAWTVWALRAAAWKSRREQPWKSAAELDAFYAQAAEEIRTAMRDGRLGSRAVPVAFMPPEWGEIIRRWPGSIRTTWGLLAKAEYEDFRDQETARVQEPNFDAAALRRETPADLAAGQETAGVWFTRERVEAFERFKRRLEGPYRWVMVGSLVLGVLGTVGGAVGMRRGRVGERWAVVMVVLWTALAARVLLLSLMDVTGLPVLERYLLVCVPVLVGLGLMGMQGVVAGLVGRAGAEGERGAGAAGARSG